MRPQRPAIKLVKAVEKFGDGFLAEEARATRNFISEKLSADTNSVVALSGSNVMDTSGLARILSNLPLTGIPRGIPVE